MKDSYVLLKDLPDAKAGTEFKKMHPESPFFQYLNIYGQMSFTPYMFAKFVENNPEWFKKEEQFDFFTKLNELQSEISRLKFGKYEAKYTEEDMRKCFEESRLTHPMVGFKHDTFDEYLKTIKP